MQAENEWTELLVELNRASGWSDDDFGKAFAPWVFGDVGQVGYPLSLLSTAVGTTQEALCRVLADRGYELFAGWPSSQLQEVWGITPGTVYPAVDLKHLPLAVMYAGVAQPASADKREARSKLRDVALGVILAWGRTEQGAREIGPFTGC